MVSINPPHLTPFFLPSNAMDKDVIKSLLSLQKIHFERESGFEQEYFSNCLLAMLSNKDRFALSDKKTKAVIIKNKHEIDLLLYLVNIHILETGDKRDKEEATFVILSLIDSLISELTESEPRKNSLIRIPLGPIYLMFYGLNAIEDNYPQKVKYKEMAIKNLGGYIYLSPFGMSIGNASAWVINGQTSTKVLSGEVLNATLILSRPRKKFLRKGLPFDLVIKVDLSSFHSLNYLETPPEFARISFFSEEDKKLFSLTLKWNNENLEYQANFNSKEEAFELYEIFAGYELMFSKIGIVFALEKYHTAFEVFYNYGNLFDAMQYKDFFSIDYSHKINNKK